MRTELWQRLDAAGLTRGDAPVPAPPASPWFVRAMLGIAGWIGALFLLAFVGVGFSFVFRNEEVALVLGLCCCVGAWGIFAAAPRNVLAGQFGLAVSIAGQIMFIFGLHEAGGFAADSPSFYLFIAIFEAVLAFLVPNFVHRLLTAFAMAVAFGYAVSMMRLYGLATPIIGGATAVIWLNDRLWAGRGGYWSAIGWGLVLAFIQPFAVVGALMRLWSSGPGPLTLWLPWVRAALLTGLLVYIVHRLATRSGGVASPRTRLAALSGAGLVGVVCLRAPGVTSALIVLLLAFSGGNRALFGLGIAALLSYLSYFYYSLAITLLGKSIALMSTGAVLILLWVVMRRWFSSDTAGHEHA